MTSKKTEFVILAILDGWGIAPAGPANAISKANTPNMNRFLTNYPQTSLSAAEDAVGLPKGEPGNTETGHLNLGAGRIVYQDLARINTSIADGTFFQNPSFLNAINHAKKNNSSIHLMGLIGAGGVHANDEHLYALIQLVSKHQFKKLFIHLFADGRDSPPTGAKTYISRLREVIKKEGVGQIASIMGRYWAMDRDLRWERTAKAYFALTKGEGNKVKTPEEAIDASYQEGKTDEFIEPSLISDSVGKPISLISNNDSIIFYNFRIDRPRQLAKAFAVKNFEESTLEYDFDPYAVKYEKKHEPKIKSAVLFNRTPYLDNLHFVSMTQYSKQLVNEGVKVAFSPEKVKDHLGIILSNNNLKQLRVSESEKERFVTYYFNGQQEGKSAGEDHMIVQSPKIPTYDSKPEMSAREMTDKLLRLLNGESKYSFILINYANPDMVGHTGNIGSTVKACEVVDECLGKLANHILVKGGTLLITGDHGNAEDMINPQTGEIDTEHSKNKVPFVVVSKKFLGKTINLQQGILGDIAPTVLSLLGIEKSQLMTGRDLLGVLKNQT